MHCPSRVALLIMSTVCGTLATCRPTIAPRLLPETTCIEGLFETNTLSYRFTLSAIFPHSEAKHNLALTDPNSLSQSYLILSSGPYSSEFLLANGRLFNTLGECLLTKNYITTGVYYLPQVHCASYFPTMYTTREYNPGEMQWVAYEACPYGRTGPSVLGLRAYVNKMSDGEC